MALCLVLLVGYACGTMLGAIGRLCLCLDAWCHWKTMLVALCLVPLVGYACGTMLGAFGRLCLWHYAWCHW